MVHRRLPYTLKDTILIAGATGLVARSLKYGLESIGCKVISISNRDVPDAITWNQLKTQGLPKETASVINCCGKNIFTPVPFNQSFKNEIYESRIGTNLALRDAILKSNVKPKTFVSMSGVGLYKFDTTIEHTEQSKEFNDGFWTDLIKDWETATDLPNGYETRRIIIRSGAILSRHGGMIQNMYPQFKLGLGGTIGSGNQYIPYIHIKDLLKLITFSIETPEVEGVVNAVAPTFNTMKELTGAFASGMNRPHFVNTPEWLVRKMFCKERCDILLGSVKVYPKKVLEHGFEFQFPDVYACMAGLIDLKY